MAKLKTAWICSSCGNSQPKWSGNCHACKEWNTFVEEVIQTLPKKFASEKTTPHKPIPLSQVSSQSVHRVTTEMRDIDRLLGGGLVPGSLVLLAGEPGIGKSTLLLQLAGSLAKKGLSILYVCGEESAEQTAMRAHRLGIDTSAIYLFSETALSQIQKAAQELHPDLLIIDSVQIVYKEELPSTPGSVTQVREVAMEMLHLSKEHAITTFLVGHVTKSGEIAGPRLLEHMVDIVLEFEGDRTQGYRLVRSLKNRFGPTDEVAFFEMGGEGLKQILNPSEAFLQERMKYAAGSSIIATLEGSRAILVEMQALVAASSFPTPSRRATGLDPKRLNLLLAVLEKRLGYQLHMQDVFVSVAGGMNIKEPAVDMGVVLAITSSILSKPIPPEVVTVGEVGLNGEVRSVTKIETRLKEAINMGFSKVLLSEKNIRGVSPDILKKIEVVPVIHLEQAVEYVLR